MSLVANLTLRGDKAGTDAGDASDEVADGEDRDEQLLGALPAADQQWRFPPSDRLPVRFTQALLAAEDKRFRSHPGVDLIAVARAVRLNLAAKRIVSGASTLTMQLVRVLAPRRRPVCAGSDPCQAQPGVSGGEVRRGSAHILRSPWWRSCGRSGRA